MSGEPSNSSDPTADVSKMSKAVELENSRKKNAAITVSIFAILAFSMVFGLIFSNDIALLVSGSDRLETIQRISSSIKIITGFIGLIAMGVISYFFASGSHHYLYNTKKIINGSGEYSEINVSVLVSAIEDIAKASKEIRENRSISEEDYKIIQKKIQESVKYALPIELVRGLEGKYGRSIKGDMVAEYLGEHINKIKNRLSVFSDDLSNKAAVSLVWGLMTAVAGIGLLAIFVWIWKTPENTLQVDIVGHYVMRVGLVALIEGIAIFFLKQYRLNLIDVKYIQNEITNIEVRFSAVVSAIRIDGDRALNEILPRLVDTERNFILKKGEKSIFMGIGDRDIGPSGSMSSFYVQLVDAVKNNRR